MRLYKNEYKTLREITSVCSYSNNIKILSILYEYLNIKNILRVYCEQHHEQYINYFNICYIIYKSN